MSAPATVFLVWGVRNDADGDDWTLVQVHATHEGQRAAMEAAARRDNGGVEIDGRVFDHLEPDARRVIA